MRWTTVWLMVAAVAAASGCVSRKPELAGDGRGGGSGSGFRPPPSTPVVMVPNTPAPPPVAPPPAVAPVKPANPDGWSGLGQKLPGAGKGEFAEERRWDPVYFAYNQSFIGASEEKKLASVAEYLKQNAKSQLRIEGHCDERGSDEYNRALGERRALAARDYLVSQKIERDRLQTVSYGEEKPVAPGGDESAFSRNRRAEFVVLVPR